MEKAFDKVWKDGLKNKLLRLGIRGYLYNWICNYLEKRTARVQVQGKHSRKRILEQGVPQGGILSPTLFLIYINDIMEGIPTGVHSAMYADDLALWTGGEAIAVAKNRMHGALHKLESWTKKWLLTINEKKTTHTIFTLSNKVKQQR